MENTGTVPDAYNITVSGLPASWSLVLLKSDGISPLVDSRFDGVPDTGEILPGETKDIVLRVQVPAGQGALGVPTDLVVRATSQGMPSVTDTTTDRMTSVTAMSMNLANTNAAHAVIEATVTQTGDADSYVDFPLIVQNTATSGAAYDTYAISATTVPSGWYVIFLSGCQPECRGRHPGTHRYPGYRADRGG